MEYYIIVFENTHGVMAAEKQLNELGFKFRLMPTPTTITMSCGMCIRIEDKKYIEEIKNNSIINYKNVYIKNQDGYAIIE